MRNHAALPAELVEAMGLVSTVQGAAKDALARRYVSLASQTKVTTLNLGALLGGERVVNVISKGTME